ncbi:MAG: T9SS type A sorting domain-containing protein, partial [Ignavibacteriota bacterium]
WKSINPQIFDYWIEISKSNTMANPIHSDTLYPEPDTTVTYPKTDFQPSTTYYWRVRGENENGMGAPSPISSFTTAVSSVADVDILSSGIVISPNPSNGETHIRFSLVKPADISLKVYDLTGNVANFTNLGRLESGKQEIIWNATGKTPGVYFYELSIGDSRQSGKIIITK